MGGGHLIVSSEHTIFSLAKNRTRNKLTMGKGAVITALCRTIHPSKHTRKKYPNMERGQRIKNAVVFCCKMKKIRQKEERCIIFNHQDFCDGDAPIKLYSLDQWCRIITKSARHLFFSDGPLEERVEAT